MVEDTVRERLARLEQGLLNHLAEAERRISANERMIDILNAHAAGIDAKIDRFGIASKVMLGLSFTIGSSIGYVIDHFSMIKALLK